jgi:hypothetical protein
MCTPPCTLGPTVPPDLWSPLQLSSPRGIVGSLLFPANPRTTRIPNKSTWFTTTPMSLGRFGVQSSGLHTGAKTVKPLKLMSSGVWSSLLKTKMPVVEGAEPMVTRKIKERIYSELNRPIIFSRTPCLLFTWQASMFIRSDRFSMIQPLGFCAAQGCGCVAGSSAAVVRPRT